MTKKTTITTTEVLPTKGGLSVTVGTKTQFVPCNDPSYKKLVNGLTKVVNATLDAGDRFSTLKKQFKLTEPICGSEVHDLRLKTKISQQELADAMGVSRRTARRYEDVQHVNPRTAVRILSAIDNLKTTKKNKK